MKKPIIWRKDWDTDCTGENAHKIYLDECPHCHQYPTYGINPCPYCGGEIDYGKEAQQ